MAKERQCLLLLLTLPSPSSPTDLSASSPSLDFGSLDALAQICAITDVDMLNHLLHECIAFLSRHRDLDRQLTSLIRSSLPIIIVSDLFLYSMPRKSASPPLPAETAASSSATSSGKRQSEQPPPDLTPAQKVARSKAARASDDSDSTPPPAAATTCCNCGGPTYGPLHPIPGWTSPLLLPTVRFALRQSMPIRTPPRSSPLPFPSPPLRTTSKP